MNRSPRIGLRHFARDEDGATLVEFAFVASIFFLLLFGLFDFARLSYTNVLAEKATERAVRMAVVRPVVCPNVPTVNNRGALGVLATDLPNGTQCNARDGLCVDAGTISCTGSAGDPTVDAIWARVTGLLPSGAVPENLLFSYTYDADLNRVGAPYAPIVTVALTDVQFDYISPLSALATRAGATNADTLGQSFAFGSMSASLPSETLR